MDDTVESLSMKFGLRYANLGRYADGAAAIELAQAAEAAGFDSIWTVEHVVVPDGSAAGLPAQVRTPEDVLRYGKEMIARFR